MYSVFFCGEVTTGDAVAALDAGLLYDALRVGPVVPEVDGDVEGTGIGVDLPRAPVEGLNLEEVGGVGHGIGVEDLADAVVIAVQLVVGQGAGPVGELEDVGVGPDGHVGIDQRGSAET